MRDGTPYNLIVKRLDFVITDIYCGLHAECSVIKHFCGHGHSLLDLERCKVKLRVEGKIRILLNWTKKLNKSKETPSKLAQCDGQLFLKIGLSIKLNTLDD